MTDYQTKKAIFAERLRKLLKEKGKTQIGLTREIDISYGSMYRYVHAMSFPRGYTLDLLAKGLGCSKSDLTGE